MSKNGSSIKAGKGIANGCSVQLYRVVGGGIVSCECCNNPMTAGATFLRKGMPGGGAGRLYPHCRNCAPYVATEEALCPSND